MCGEQFRFQSVSPPRERRSSPIVATDSCATPGLRGGKVETVKHVSLVGLQRREGASDMQLYVGELLVCLPLQNSEQMLRDLIKEAEKWDLTPKPASLCWTSTYEAEDLMYLLPPTD